MKRIEIHGWGGPTPTEENYRDYKEAGFTTVLYCPDDFGYTYGNKQVVKDIQLMEKFGLDFIAVAHPRGEWTNFPIKGDATDYTKFKAYKGAFLCDEPSRQEHVEWIASLVEDFEKNNPGKEFRYNMSLGYQGEQFSPVIYPDSFQRVRLTCDWMCASILDKLHGKKVFSTDYYPLRECGLQHDYLYPLEYAAIKSKKHGYEFFNYIQSSGGWCDWDPAREIKSVEDLRFQILCSFAYGATGIGYFTYGTDPNFLYTGLFVNGALTEKYYFAKQVNEEIHAIEDIYLQYSWEKSGLVFSDEPAKYAKTCKIRLIANADKFTNIEKIKGARDILVGEMVNKDGKPAHWIVNYIEPSEAALNVVRLMPEIGCKIKAVYFNGKQIEAIKDGSDYVFSMKNGEGVFVLWE